MEEDLTLIEARERKSSILRKLHNLEAQTVNAQEIDTAVRKLVEKKANITEEIVRLESKKLSILEETKRAESNLIVIKRDEEAARKAHEENISTFKKSMIDEIHNFEEKKRLALAELSELESKKQELLNANSTLKRSFEEEMKHLISKRDILQSEVEKWEVSFSDRKSKSEADLEAREKAVAAKEAYADKRERWNEQVRIRLSSYKAELEDYYKRTFPDIIIGDK